MVSTAGVMEQVKACFKMANGGTANVYFGNIANVLQFENEHNDRYTDIPLDDSGAPLVPWVADPKKLSDRIKNSPTMLDKSLLPQSLAEIDVPQVLSGGSAKSAAWITLAGPLGKCLLAGLFPRVAGQASQVEAVLMEYLDIISEAWEYVTSVSASQGLESRLAECLSKLELELPSWELNINRHNMMHMFEGVQRFGPLWSWSMFADERSWHWMGTLIKNVARPAASCMQRWRLYHLAFVAEQHIKVQGTLSTEDRPLTLTIDVVEEEDGSLAFPQFNDFRDDSFELKDEVGEPIQLSRRLTDRDTEMGYSYKLQIHECLLQYPELVKSCAHRPEPKDQCTSIPKCPSYEDLWQAYKTDMRLPDYGNVLQRCKHLRGWYVWATDKERNREISPDQRKLCKGPVGDLHRYKSWKVGGACFCTYSKCQHHISKPCTVMMHHDGQVSFGQVHDFLVFAPPGVSNEVGLDTTHPWACKLVRCKWYKPGVATSEYEVIDSVTGLRVVKSTPAVNAVGGDIWPLGSLAAVEVGLYPYWKNPALMAAVSKRCAFVDRTRAGAAVPGPMI